ncbi:hypothetical protein [Pandoraea sputorum]|uniref:Uncharacterized protein n=1 Tax=Pandoraea sputorum TaxID=93222 RepID=A0A5E5BN07_9BURK|nr:hypothetical protein [Pandoraea sputorum]VVE85883.1 hypothetical protein PSP31121_05516 [Pandoraea sputorum]
MEEPALVTGDLPEMPGASNQKLFKALADRTPGPLLRETVQNTLNANVVVQPAVETRGTPRADAARPRDHFLAVWVQVGTWFPAHLQRAAWDLLGQLLSENASVAERLSCLDNLEQVAHGAHKSHFKAEAPGDPPSFRLPGAFQVTLNERAQTCEFQMHCRLPE